MSDMDPEQRSLRFVWHLPCVAHRKPWVGVCVLEEPEGEGSFSSCAARGSEHFKEEANLQHLGRGGLISRDGLFEGNFNEVALELQD